MSDRASTPAEHVVVRAEDLRAYVAIAEDRFVGQSIPSDEDNRRAAEIARRFREALGDSVPGEARGPACLACRVGLPHGVYDCDERGAG